MFNKFKKKIVLPVVTAGIIFSTPIISKAALGDNILNYGMNNEDIKVLQEDLKQLGFFEIDNTTTYYDYYTVRAVKQLQSELGLDSTGEYDEKTHNAFNEYKENKVKDGKILIYNGDLKSGSKGRDVNLLQNRLKDLGYLVINNTTEYYGSMTVDAVKLFQKNYGLNETGVADQRTYDLINDILAGRVEKKEVPTRSTATPRGNQITSIAQNLRGRPYRYGANGPSAFDCSGFTRYVYAQAGYNIPRTSVGQAGVGTRVNRSQLQPGDLVVFANTYGGRRGISHAGIYIGNGKFIHASTSRGVVIDSLSSGYYNSRFAYGRRL